MVHRVSLKSRSIQLRTIGQDDIGLLVDWRNDPSSLHLWSSRRALVTQPEAHEEAWQDLQKDKHVWLMAENTRHQVVGMVYSYNAQFVDQHCFTTTCVANEYRSRGYGPEMQALFLNYLFTYFNFRKVYCEVYGYNELSRHTIETFGFVQEGHFPEHRYYDGGWHSLIRYAIYRGDLDRIRAFLAKRTPRSL